MCSRKGGDPLNAKDKRTRLWGVYLLAIPIIVPLLFFLFPKGSPSAEPGKSCVSLNPGKSAKWENLQCVQKLGYICKKGNTTLNSFVIPSGK